VSVIRPHAASDAYTIALHFDSVANLRKWLDSETRVHLMEKIRPYLRAAEAINIKTGFEFWFTPPLVGRPQFIGASGAPVPVLPRLRFAARDFNSRATSSQAARASAEVCRRRIFRQTSSNAAVSWIR